MAWRKTHDLCVVTGSYMKEGESRNRYENVGQVLVGDDGNEMLMLKRSFNPAGVPFKEGGDMIIVNRFEVRTDEQRGGGSGGARGGAPQRERPAPATSAPKQDSLAGDDIPFATQYANF